MSSASSADVEKLLHADRILKRVSPPTTRGYTHPSNEELFRQVLLIDKAREPELRGKCPVRTDRDR